VGDRLQISDGGISARAGAVIPRRLGGR
jgi:hypothetical protein